MMMSNRYYIHSVDTCRQSSALPIVNIEFVMVNGLWFDMSFHVQMKTMFWVNFYYLTCTPPLERGEI